MKFVLVALLSGVCATCAVAQTPPVPLSLDAAIALAFSQNGDTLAAARSADAARFDITTAKAPLKPQVSLGASYDYYDQRGKNVTTVPGNTTGNGDTFRTKGGDTSTSLSFSQTLFDSGTTRAHTAGARALADRALANEGSERNELAYLVAQRFYEQLRQSQLVSQREGQIRVAQTSLEQVRAQVAAGTVARADSVSAQVTVSQAQLDLATAKNDLRAAQVNLRAVLGLSHGEPLVLSDDIAASVDASKAPEIENAALPIENYLETARRMRPDLAVARADVENAESSVRLAQIEARPKITASAGYSIEPVATENRGFTFGADVSLPIFDGGSRRAKLNSARATRDAAQLRLLQTQNEAAADVEVALANIEGQQERLKNSRALLEQAQINLDNANVRYRAGAGILLDVLSAQDRFFAAQNSLTAARYDRKIADMNLSRAVGTFAVLP